jgi:MerR family transcriptional regulator, redox-sensitive transcriptional activator SoxR
VRAWTISEAAAQVGINPSAIRYYERIGLLPPATRVSGQRRYDSIELYRLGVLLQSALHNGEAAESWRAASESKLAELELQIREIRGRQDAIRSIVRKCHCKNLEECGRRILEKVTVSKSGRLDNEL